MASGTNLGQAYVQVMPSAEGISGQLSGIFENEGSAAGNKFGSKFSSVMKGVGIAGAVAAAATIAKKVSDVVNEAVDQYADYEQLTGGVEKLFGSSANTVKKYAENAYKTAGLSANKYMEQITSFSASLISSLNGDTVKAAEIGNKAVEDMSDNANTFGTDIQSIQNAYQGFAKQNYTMLDNLKLGYGGTKTEMQRLIQDAEKLNKSFTATRDANGDLTLSFADVVNAIHIVQDDMNITGTTAREAAGTISGSAASTQAAWVNLQTVMADKNGDTKEAVKTWVDAVATSTEQRFDAMTTVLSNIPETVGAFVTAAAGKINDMLLSTTSYGEAIVNTKDLLLEHEQLLTNYNAILQEGLTPLKEAESYWTTFKGLIEENGTISEDHMTQADYLAQRINEQLGTQYSTQELINGLLGDESSSLDGILKKKEYEVELEASRALMKETEAELDELMAQSDANAQQIEQLKEMISIVGVGSAAYADLAWSLGTLEEEQNDLTKTIETDSSIMSQCWDNEAYAAEGAYERIITQDSEAIKSAENVTQGRIDNLDKQIEHLEQTIALRNTMITDDNANLIRIQNETDQEQLNNLKIQRDAELSILAEKNAQKHADENKANSLTLQWQNQFLSAYRSNLNTGATGAATDFKTNKDSMEKSANELYSNVTKKVGNMAADAKKATDFQWSLPALKLPHFSASGSFSLNPLTIPEFGVSWYSKAMDEAQVLNGATIFGTADGKLLGGGEVGSEVISGEEHLIELINSSVSSVLGPMVPAMLQIAQMLDLYLPEAAKRETQIYLDGDTMVGKLAPKFNNKLGSMGRLKARGI